MIDFEFTFDSGFTMEVVHHHHHHGTGRVLQWSFAATLLFVLVEAAAGMRSGSLALLSDAGHNFTDALALGLAWVGVYLEAKPADSVRTYGYRRAGVLVAFVNALTLVIIALWIFWEAAQRLRHPEPVQIGWMLGVAALGLVLNSGIMWGLRHDHGNDVNIRAAFLHMLGDAVSTAAIMIGAAIIRYTGWQAVDPILSMLIGVLIVWTAVGILRETLNVLLEGLPSGLSLPDVVGAMQKVDGVVDVHDLHIWSLGSQTHALSCHVLIEDMPPSESETILQQINRALGGFHIRHTTVQFEHTRCALADGDCCAPAVPAHNHAH